MQKDQTDPRLLRIIEIKRELDERKKLFEEFDRLVLELAREGFDRARIGEQVAILKDNFKEGKNTGWTAAAVRHYDIELISAALAEKRAR